MYYVAKVRYFSHKNFSFLFEVGFLGRMIFDKSGYVLRHIYITTKHFHMEFEYLDN